jgi:hypothetical protein
LRNKILVSSLVLLLISIFLVSIPVSPVKAVGEGQWFTSYTIVDNNSNQVLVQYDSSTGLNQTLSPVIPGSDVKVTFTVNVFAAGSGDLKLQTGMGKLLSDRYWELVTQDYPLGSDFNPNANPAQFSWTVGTFTMSVYGKIPTSTSQSGAPVNIVSLFGPTGGVAIDQISIKATTALMTQFQSLYDQKVAHLKSLQSSGVAQEYIDLYNILLNASKTEADAGSVSNAIALLNGLNTANEPISSAMTFVYIPLIVVLAVIAALFAVLFLRVRGKVSYFQLVVEDQIKDLEGLTLRASKIDRAMSSNLDSVKERLKRIVGM